MDRPGSRSKYPDLGEEHLEESFVDQRTHDGRYDDRKKKRFPELKFSPDQIGDYQSEYGQHERNIAYFHRKIIEKCSIKILESMDDRIFEGVERSEE